MKIQSSGAQFKSIQTQNTPTTKAYETLQKKGQRYYKIRLFVMRLCLLIMSETTPVKTHAHDCPNMSWSRMATIGMPKQTRKDLWDLNPIQRSIGQIRNVESGRKPFPQGRGRQQVIHYQVISSENIYANNIIIQTERAIFWNLLYTIHT